LSPDDPQRRLHILPDGKYHTDYTY
jgi:hypothetical protein